MLTLRDLMTPAPVTIAPGATLRDAVELWDDAGSDVDERFRVTDSPEWDFLSEHRVEEAMLSDPAEFPPQATVDEAVERMRATGAHGVLVVDDGRLGGIVTTMDITLAFADQARIEMQ
jgi:CBS domain-containing protein